MKQRSQLNASAFWVQAFYLAGTSRWEVLLLCTLLSLSEIANSE